MNPLRSLSLLLFLCLRLSLAIAISSHQTIEATVSALAFFPRGGGAGSFTKRGRRASPSSSNAIAESDSDAAAATTQPENDTLTGDNSKESDPSTFDRQEVVKRLHKEELAEMKKTQQFLQKQQRRRELDTTWLDKGITAVIEFFENIFRWEVIDV